MAGSWLKCPHGGRNSTSTSCCYNRLVSCLIWYICEQNILVWYRPQNKKKTLCKPKGDCHGQGFGSHAAQALHLGIFLAWLRTLDGDVCFHFGEVYKMIVTVNNEKKRIPESCIFKDFKFMHKTVFM